MNNNIIDIILYIAAIIVIFSLVYTLEETRNERDKYQKAAYILSDCVHNMIDNYGDPDDIYSNYINIAYEETGIKEQEFINYSYCY